MDCIAGSSAWLILVELGLLSRELRSSSTKPLDLASLGFLIAWCSQSIFWLFTWWLTSKRKHSQEHENRSYWLLAASKSSQNLVAQTKSDLLFFIILWVRNLGQAVMDGSSAPCGISHALCCIQWEAGLALWSKNSYYLSGTPVLWCFSVASILVQAHHSFT